MIGMMGCGKSAAGPLLAQLLGRKFIDLDLVIVTEARQTIEQIFRDHGEDHFRLAEARQLALACRLKGKIIACGGGVVLSVDNRRTLKNQQTVFLSVSPGVLQRRLGSGKGRPLLDDSAPMRPGPPSKTDAGAPSRLLARRAAA